MADGTRGARPERGLSERRGRRRAVGIALSAVLLIGVVASPAVADGHTPWDIEPGDDAATVFEVLRTWVAQTSEGLVVAVLTISPDPRPGLDDLDVDVEEPPSPASVSSSIQTVVETVVQTVDGETTGSTTVTTTVDGVTTTTTEEIGSEIATPSPSDVETPDAGETTGEKAGLAGEIIDDAQERAPVEQASQAPTVTPLDLSWMHGR